LRYKSQSFDNLKSSLGYLAPFLLTSILKIFVSIYHIGVPTYLDIYLLYGSIMDILSILTHIDIVAIHMQKAHKVYSLYGSKGTLYFCYHTITKSYPFPDLK